MTLEVVAEWHTDCLAEMTLGVAAEWLTDCLEEMTLEDLAADENTAEPKEEDIAENIKYFFFFLE
jgi:hypothetical protein